MRVIFTLLVLASRLAFSSPAKAKRVLESVPSAVNSIQLPSDPYPAPLPCTGEACTYITASMQDCNVIQHTNGTYFRFSKSNTTGVGLELSTAPSLAGPWMRQTPVLGTDVQLKDVRCNTPELRANCHLWTPDVHYSNGTYYLYYSVFNGNYSAGESGVHGFDIAVATSPSMEEGSWTDQGSVTVPQPERNSMYTVMDSNIIHIATDPQTQPIQPLQMVFGSQGSALVAVNLSSSLLTVDSYYTSQLAEPVIVDQPALTAGSAPSNMDSTSYIFQYQEWNYIMWSNGSCCAAAVEDDYSIVICRATLDMPAGPYFDMNGGNCSTSGGSAGTVLLQSHMQNSNGGYEVKAPGSPGIMSTSSGIYITYQYANQSFNSDEPETFFFGYNLLEFSNGWPSLVAGG